MIKYTDGYKYQLAEDYQIMTDIMPEKLIDTPLLRLDVDGLLTIRRGYAWDGASGPTIDTKSSMRGALVHDAFYQLMRMDLLGQHNREAADCLLRDICIEDGMLTLRAKLWYFCVRKFAMPSANAESDREILTAP